MPIQYPIEMGMILSDLEITPSHLAHIPSLFNAAFGTDEITSERISRALSQFMRSIASNQTKYDEGISNNFAY